MSGVEGLSACDRLGAEAIRIERHVAPLPKEGWLGQSRWERLPVRDVVAHVAVTGAFHHAWSQVRTALSTTPYSRIRGIPVQPAAQCVVEALLRTGAR